MKKYLYLACTVLLLLLTSCSVNSESTFYKDATTSMETKILMDQGMIQMLNLYNRGDLSAQTKGLTHDWKSLYDIQKDNRIILNGDSAAVLKKVFVKLNNEQNEVAGISLKYDKMSQDEINKMFSQSREMKNLPLQNFANWDGRTLTIDTEKFDLGMLGKMAEDRGRFPGKQPETKRDSLQMYGRKMAEGMAGMMRMFNADISATLKFQRPIKDIAGRHDFVQQVDNKTVKVTLRSYDLLNPEKLENKDKKIVITTK